MRATFRNALLFVTALASAGASAHTITTSPAEPTAGEELLLSVNMQFGSGPKSLISSETRVDAQQITVTATIQGPDFAAGGAAHALVATRGLEAGSYEVFLVVRNLVTGTTDTITDPPVFVGRVFVAPGAAATPLYLGLNGNYFDLGSPGWGANMVQGGSRSLFVGWFDYESRSLVEAGEPQDGTWRVVSSGKWITPTLFRGVAYTTRGTPPNLPWSPGSLQVIPDGYVTLTFSSATQALFEGQGFIASTPAAPTFSAQPFQRRATIRRFQF